MSVEIYKPFGEFGPKYEIGTEGRELFPIAEGSSVFGTLLNAARSLYNNVTGLADIIVPTYGLWAGPGMTFLSLRTYVRSLKMQDVSPT